MSEVSNPTPPIQAKMAQFDPAHHAVLATNFVAGLLPATLL